MTDPTVRAAVIAVMCLVLVSACAPMVGGPSTLRDMSRYLALAPGRTTKAEIHAQFGQPYDVQPTDEGSQWVYYFFVERSSGWTYVPFAGCLAGGSDIDTTVTTLAFDTTDRLLRFDVQERHTYKNMWVGLSELANQTDRPDLRVEQELVRLQLPFDAKAARWLHGVADFTK